MPKITKAEFEKGKIESKRLVGKVLQDASHDPESKRQVTESARSIIQDSSSSKNAKASSMFLLGKMQSESAVPDLIENLDKPVIDPEEKRMPYGQADALTAIVMIGEKAVPFLKESIDTIGVSKLRKLVSALYLITKETSFIKGKLTERLNRAAPGEKPEIQKILDDVNTWNP